MKSIHGGGLSGSIVTITPATTTTIPDAEDVFYLSGSATITSLVASVATRGREVTFIQISGTTTFTNTADTTTANKMRCSTGATFDLVAGDACKFYLTGDGWWVRISSADNSA